MRTDRLKRALRLLCALICRSVRRERQHTDDAHVRKRTDAAIAGCETVTATRIRKFGSGITPMNALLGDVGLAKGIPAVHCRMTVGLEDGSVRGGHSVGATASPTLESMLIVEPGVLQKQFGACSGLTLFRPGS